MNINSQGNGFVIQNTYSGMGERIKTGNKSLMSRQASKEEAVIRKLQTEEKGLNIKENHSERQVTFSEDGDILEISLTSSNQEKEAPKKVRILDEAKGLPIEKEQNAFEKQKKVLKKNEENRKEALTKKEAFKKTVKLNEKKAEARAELLKINLPQEKEEKEEPQISFAGKTESDIAKMYLRGDISKAEYENEIEKLEKKKEARQEKDEKFTKDVLQASSLEEEMVRFEKELKLTFSREEPMIFSEKDRLNVLEAAKGEGNASLKREKKIAVS